MEDDLFTVLAGIGKKYGIDMPAPPAPTPTPAPASATGFKMPEAPATPNLAEVGMTKWDEIKKAIYEATSKGLGRWLSGPGDPRRLLNPFLPLSGPGPGQIYGPERTRGVGAMGKRLRLIEDETSVPMRSLAEVSRQNPLIQQSRISVADLPGATGKISYRDPERPEITLAPVLDPSSDPGLTAVHEIVGHGSHGPVAWRATDQMEMEQRIRPQAEGTATGVERGVYRELAPVSTYDVDYRTSDYYGRAKALGESLAQHITKTGHVPHWTTVQGQIFGPPPATPTAKRENLATAGPKPKPETPAAKGTQGTQRKLSAPGSLPAAFGGKPKPKDPSNILRAFGLYP